MSMRDERRDVLLELYRMDLLKDFNLSKVFDTKYQKKFFNKYFENRLQIDIALSECLCGWSLETLSKTDLACIRLSMCEILYMEDIPNSVSINEAIELSKIYGDEKSPKFVNGILKAFV